MPDRPGFAATIRATARPRRVSSVAASALEGSRSTFFGRLAQPDTRKPRAIATRMRDREIDRGETRAIGLGGVVAGALAQAPAAGAGTMTATAPGKGVAANVVEITASVQAIDKANRTVTIKGPRGRVETVTAGPEVKNFDQIKVGDNVVLRYV